MKNIFADLSFQKPLFRKNRNGVFFFTLFFAGHKLKVAGKTACPIDKMKS